jgi:hypothetical protein
VRLLDLTYLRPFSRLKGWVEKENNI